jgi:CIC family chloride channel protein
MTALLTSWLVMPHSIMTEKIARRGRSVVEHYGADFKDVVLVADVMNSVLASVRETDTVQNLKVSKKSSKDKKEPKLNDP